MDTVSAAVVAAAVAVVAFVGVEVAAVAVSGAARRVEAFPVAGGRAAAHGPVAGSPAGRDLVADIPVERDPGVAALIAVRRSARRVERGPVAAVLRVAAGRLFSQAAVLRSVVERAVCNPVPVLPSEAAPAQERVLPRESELEIVHLSGAVLSAAGIRLARVPRWELVRLPARDRQRCRVWAVAQTSRTALSTSGNRVKPAHPACRTGWPTAIA